MASHNYQDTHPFLSFRLNTQALPLGLWVLLGEIASKCEHIANAPLLPEVASRLHTVYLAKGVLATTAIEGNTLREQEVLQILKGDYEALPSKQYLQQEVQNIIDICNGFLRRKPPVRLGATDVLELHAQVMRGLPVDDGVLIGAWRNHNVTAGRYRAPDAQCVVELMDTFLEWWNSFPQAIAPGLELHTAILKSILVHLYFVWIHPFGDGNGRTARMLEFMVLLSAGFPSPAAHLLSNFYNETRTQYYRELDRASKQPVPVDFCVYAAQGFRDGLVEQIQSIQQQQRQVMFIHLVHQSFMAVTTDTAKRQRELALAIAQHAPEPVAIADLPVVHPGVARLYAAKTTKPLIRDINVLVKMQLVRFEGKNTIVAMLERVRELLPPRF
jgi:Fic family protein